MATPARCDELARVEPRAIALDRRHQELSGGGDACHVRVELTELPLRERVPGGLPCAEHFADLGDREPGFLQEGDGSQAPEDRQVVLASTTGPSGRRDQPDLLVVPESRALQPGRAGDLADADEIPVRHCHAPLDLKRTSSAIVDAWTSPRNRSPAAWTAPSSSIGPKPGGRSCSARRAARWKVIVSSPSTRTTRTSSVVCASSSPPRRNAAH